MRHRQPKMFELLDKVIERCWKIDPFTREMQYRIGLMKGVKEHHLDLQVLLDSSDYEFCHDVRGLSQEDPFFVPRCAQRRRKYEKSNS